ncbi:vacuolar protein 14-like protein [Nitzschia inconspicua]|uniref:Vacuolar protein 14-like protein n=1 Tax=Nitzschia inconspicua TaxID=303405 RepID=A0A9K3LQV6_9STRA|nr:vacuolar protein 14-like protein [Nitzschia inconspicua]
MSSKYDSYNSKNDAQGELSALDRGVGQQQHNDPSGNNSIAAGSIGGGSMAASIARSAQQPTTSIESPLSPMVLRSLGDRSNEKRKVAALEIEALVKSLQDTNNILMIQNVVEVLSKDFCTSMNSNYRKGGLVGLAAVGIGLMMHNCRQCLPILLPPILHCFDDPESRVRYYACESLYNIAKVSRQGILLYFNPLFEGLTKVIADVDLDVKNAALLLDRLIKDIVTEADSFQVDQFLPLLQKYIQRTNPYIRQLIVGWITLLDSVPDISMLDFLPDFLDGLYSMLSDSNREIRQAADSALSEFLKELSGSTVTEFGPIISILVYQCQSKEPLNRLTAITWLAELIHHPYSGGDALLPYHSEILGAIMNCISDGEVEIRMVAERTNDDLLKLVKQTSSPFELRSLLETLIHELLNKEDVSTKMAALGWINMLMEKRKSDMNLFIEQLLPVLIRTLSDPSDAVVLLNLQVLSRISLAQRDEKGNADESEEEQFTLVLNAILSLFSKDRQLLETRGSLIIRKLCVLLNAKSVYIRLATALMKYEKQSGPHPVDMTTLEFVSTMVQTLNLILLTASELHDLRSTLSKSFINPYHTSNKQPKTWNRLKNESQEDSIKVFVILFRCWSHNPVATFSLCLLAQAYTLSFSLVKRFSQMDDVSVGFLMQIDKLVYLLESPIFVHLRLKLLDVEDPNHAPLLKSIYGVLLCLPQGDAFRLLNNRLTTVCNLRDNLGLKPLPDLPGSEELGCPSNSPTSGADRFALCYDALLVRYDEVTEMHRISQEQHDSFVQEEKQRLQIHVMSAPTQQQQSIQISPSVPSAGSPMHQSQYTDKKVWN